MSTSAYPVGTGGGGGRTLGPMQNTFGDSSTTDRSTAEGLRDAYAAANSDWLARYDGNHSFLILLQWTGDNEVVQRRNVAGDDWDDVVDVIKGQKGDKGDKGDVAGIPNYVATGPSYDAASNELSATVDPSGAGDIELRSIVFFQAPAAAALPRDAGDMRLVLNASGNRSWSAPLFRIGGTRRVQARHLRPLSLLQCLFHRGTRATLVEPLDPRPQDFDLVIAWLPEPPFDTQAVFEAGVAAGAADSATNAVSLPNAPAGVGGTDRRFVVVGVPVVAPDIGRLRTEPPGQGEISVPLIRWTFADSWEYSSTPYKWWSIGLVLGSLAGREYRAEFLPYS